MKKVILIIIFTFLLTSCGKDSEIKFWKADMESDTESNPESSLEVRTSESVTIEEYINVFVSGCVNNPDVYRLKRGSIIKEAVDMAGGFSDGACKDYVNLAKKLEGGEHIVIPSIDEMENLSLSLPEEESKTKNTFININTATKEELMSLPGIGERKADSIIEYRKNKPFNAIEDIMNISGIKEAAFNKIKDKICIN